MRLGDTLRFIGPAGAPFVITIGAAFDARTINNMIDSGEWTPAPSDTEPGGGLTAPARGGSKAAWIAYAIDRGADPAAAKRTPKADLIATYGPPPATHRPLDGDPVTGPVPDDQGDDEGDEDQGDEDWSEDSEG